MFDSLTLGPVPAEETCVQVSKDDYLLAMRVECKRFKDLLVKAFPPPMGGYYKIKSNSHDFGTYLEVEAVFAEDDEKAVEWAFNVEAKIPGTWEELEDLALKVIERSNEKEFKHL